MPKGIEEYYDAYSTVYDEARRTGYHRLIDDLAFAVLKPYAEGKRVLEAGCGTGLILERAAAVAAEATGCDRSEGMLKRAREKGLAVVQADIAHLPFPDRTFDTAYSLKVLPHVQEIEAALAELARVVKPGGHLLLEFYNPLSLRGLIKKLKPATPVAPGAQDEEVYTRYDGLKAIRSYLPGGVTIEAVRGLRIATPWAALHDLPLLSPLLAFAERRLMDSPLKRFAGFLIVIARREG